MRAQTAPCRSGWSWTVRLAVRGFWTWQIAAVGARGILSDSSLLRICRYVRCCWLWWSSNPPGELPRRGFYGKNPQMAESGTPFHFLDDAEFGALGLAEKHDYLAAALKELTRLNAVIQRQIRDLRPEG